MLDGIEILHRLMYCYPNMPEILVPTFEPVEGRLYPTVFEVDTALRGLGHQVIEFQQESGTTFQASVAITRGGLDNSNVVPRMIGIDPLYVLTMGMQSYKGEQQTTKEPVFGLVPNEEHVYGLDVLLLDELSDTGFSELFGKKKLIDLGANSVQSAVGFWKQERNETGESPDFYSETIKGWTVLPCEIYDEYAEARQRLIEAGASHEHFKELDENLEKAIRTRNWVLCA